MSDDVNSDEYEPLDEVGDALALTVEVLEDAIGDLKAATQEAVHDEKFDAVVANNERIRELRSFASEVDSLLGRWARLASHGGSAVKAKVDDRQPEAEPEERLGRTYFGRAKRGTRTPEAEFRLPLLEVLCAAGGSLPVTDAIDRVGERMADRFTVVDLESLPSDPRTIRWRNTVQWSRNVLADDGYIDRSVRGVWTITEAGREWLARRR